MSALCVDEQIDAFSQGAAFESLSKHSDYESEIILLQYK